LRNEISLQRSTTNNEKSGILATKTPPELSESSIMTRADLIAALSSRFPRLMPTDAKIAVKEILDAIGQSLVKGDHVEIRGFGSFGLNRRLARKGRNPKTGESVSVPEKFVPHFKVGKGMRTRVERSVEPKPLRRTA